MASDLDYFKFAANTYQNQQQQQMQYLQAMAQQEARDRLLTMQQEEAERKNREMEREAYAKWERDQIMNQVAGERMKDLSLGNVSVSEYISGNQKAAAQEALRRGRPDYAMEFMQKFEQAEAERMAAAQKAEKEKIEMELKQQQLAGAQRKAEAEGRGAPVDLLDLGRANDIFASHTKDAADNLARVRIARETLAAAEAGIPDAENLLNAELVKMVQGGKLSNKDIENAEKAGSIGRRVSDALSRFVTGTSTTLAHEQRAALLDIFERKYGADFNKGVDKFEAQIRMTNAPDNLIKTYLDRRYIAPEPVKPKPKTVIFGAPPKQDSILPSQKDWGL